MRLFTTGRHKRQPRSARGDTSRQAGAPAPLVDQRALAQAVRGRVVKDGGVILNNVFADLKRGERARLEGYWESLSFCFDVVELSDTAGTGRPHATTTNDAPLMAPAATRYVVSSWFLVECHEYLFGNSQVFEVMHLVTGSKIGQTTRTLDRLLKVSLSDQSSVSASANREDLDTLLRQIDAWGHSMHGLFHSHPGAGALATIPSGVDWETQQRYERGGYPLIGGIFSRDGFIRFFATTLFEINVFGTGVKQYDPHLFKIHFPDNSPRHLPDDALENAQSVHAQCV